MGHSGDDEPHDQITVSNNPFLLAKRFWVVSTKYWDKTEFPVTCYLVHSNCGGWFVRTQTV